MQIPRKKKKHTHSTKRILWGSFIIIEMLQHNPFSAQTYFKNNNDPTDIWRSVMMPNGAFISVCKAIIFKVSQPSCVVYLVHINYQTIASIGI